jgi:hypothetical protein
MKKSAPRKLVVRGETLRAFTSLELRHAVGGGDSSPAVCSARRFDSDPAICPTRAVTVTPSKVPADCNIGG